MDDARRGIMPLAIFHSQLKTAVLSAEIVIVGRECMKKLFGIMPDIKVSSKTNILNECVPRSRASEVYILHVDDRGIIIRILLEIISQLLTATFTTRYDKIDILLSSCIYKSISRTREDKY